jgi:MFS family permease
MRDRHYRRNFVALVGDYVGFGLALTFASQTTVLPNFVRQLTDSKVVIGLLSTLTAGAWLLPQLVFANLLTNKRRKKPYVILGAAIGRPLVLLYAVALWLGLHRNPTLALVLFLASQTLFYATDSMAAVAWFDVLAKALPENRRGRLISVSQIARGLLGIAVGPIIFALLGENAPAFPHNYALIFASTAGLLLFSLLSFSFLVEPDEAVEEERPSWHDYLPLLLSTLRRDRAFRRLNLVRVLAGFDLLALSFYIVYATEGLGLSDKVAGIYNTVQTVGAIVASLGLGWVSERFGNHRVIQISTALGLTAPLAALAMFLTGASGGTATTVVFSWIFFVIGAVASAFMLGLSNYMLDLAPPGQRPTYIGLFNTIGGVLVFLPTVGGWLLRATSFGVLFGLTAAFLVVAHLLSWGLPPVREGGRENPSSEVALTGAG